MSQKLIRQAPAKLNLVLRITKRREDGFHELASLFVRIDLTDELIFEIEPNSAIITLTCDDPKLPTDERNLVVKAARKLQQLTGCQQGVRIELKKRIPAEAGLGGGSSDAATTLLALNELWQLNRSQDELAKLGAELGSDIGFFLVQASAAWCTGRGEIVEPLPDGPRRWFVLVCPKVGSATPAVYRELNWPLGHQVELNLRSQVEAAFIDERIEPLAMMLANDLEAPAFRLAPILASWKERLNELQPVGTLMSGSGSTLVALCRDEADARRIAAAIQPLADAGITDTGGSQIGAQVLICQC
jgi:4-diphosphocytidyl-2-C-methyl-D-erythritol kinase